jgi:Gpi18-like mannosyltransferase
MKTWIKKHATWANLFFALACAYASAGVLHLAIVGFDWWTLADVVAYSTLLWVIASSSKQEAMHLKELERLTNQNQRLKDQLRGAGL